MGSQSNRKRHNSQGRIGEPEGREYGASGDVQILHGVHLAIDVDNPLIGIPSHTRGPEMMGLIVAENFSIYEPVPEDL